MIDSSGIFLYLIYLTLRCFDEWADKLEMACSISGRDIRLEAICYSSGPVRQILLTIPDRTSWEDIKAELRRKCFKQKGLEPMQQYC